MPIGAARTYCDGTDITLLTFGNGVYMSLRAAYRLLARGIGARVVDMRWIAPLPIDDILREAEATGAVLVVDETRCSGGVAEGVLAALIDGGFSGRMARVTSKDSFIRQADAAQRTRDRSSRRAVAGTSLSASPGSYATPTWARHFIHTRRSH